MLGKLGFHVQGFTHAAISAVKGQRNVAGIKTMDLQPWAVETLQEWKRNNPGGLVTYRYYVGPDAEGAGANLERWKEFCDRLATYVKKNAPNGLVDAVYIPFNEVAPYNVDRYAELHPIMCDYLREQFLYYGGMKVIGGNFSVTTPHPIELWDKMGAALESMDYLCLHRYSKTSLREGNEWLFDFEQIYARLKSKGFATPKLILGEFGIDGALWTDGTMSDAERFKGWHAFQSPENFATELQEAHLRLYNNPDVLFAAVFNLDQYPPKNWDSYLYANVSEVVNVFQGPTAEQLAARTSQSPPSAPPPSDPTGPPAQQPPDPPVAEVQPVSDLPDWIHPDIAINWRQWREDDRNTWPRGTQKEKDEFWEHAARIDVDVARYRTDSPKAPSAALDRAVSRYTIWARDPNNRGPKEGLDALGSFLHWLHVRGIDPASAFDEGFPHIEESDEENGNVEHRFVLGHRSGFTKANFQRMAQILDCNELLLRSLIKRESGNAAFNYASGLLVIRFEPHLMERFTRDDPDLHKQVVEIFEGQETWQGSDDYVQSNGTWTPIHTKGQISEWGAYEIASGIDEEIATRAISMGIFQMLGDNHELCGFQSAVQMMDSFNNALTNQAFAFINFIMEQPSMHDALKRGDIEEFVREWNGPGQVARVSALIRQDLRGMS